MISSRLETTLQRAIELARASRHEYTTLEHLLIALLEDEDTKHLTKTLRLKEQKLKKNLLKILKDGKYT
mgnify:CR=1 FL=1